MIRESARSIYMKLVKQKSKLFMSVGCVRSGKNCLTQNPQFMQMIFELAMRKGHWKFNTFSLQTLLYSFQTLGIKVGHELTFNCQNQNLSTVITSNFKKRQGPTLKEFYKKNLVFTSLVHDDSLRTACPVDPMPQTANILVKLQEGPAQINPNTIIMHK